MMIPTRTPRLSNPSPRPKERQQQNQPLTKWAKCMKSLESKLPSPLVRLKDDLKPLMYELRILGKTEQKVPTLGNQETLTTKMNQKMHLLQIKMAIQEMILTRRARKSNRILEKYKTNQASLTREFANLNPTQKKILSDEAKTTLSSEIAELDRKTTNRATRRKRSSAQAKATQQ